MSEKLAVVELERRLQEGGGRVESLVEQLLDAGSDTSDSEPVQKALLKTIAEGTKFFNEVEQSVADSDLLGAHENRRWVHTKAQSVLNLLKEIPLFYRMIRETADKHGLPHVVPAPSSTAFAAMQQLVAEHFDREAAAVRNAFVDAGLPTYGFENPLPAKPVVHGASLSFDDGVLKLAEGLNSEDATKIALGHAMLDKRSGVAKGAVGGVNASRVLDALNDFPPEPRKTRSRVKGAKHTRSGSKSSINRKASTMPAPVRNVGTSRKTKVTSSPDPKTVFVVHGRNEKARQAMFTFLRALGLNPLEWEEAVLLTGSASPYVGEVIEKGMAAAQAVVVLLTGDDEARLRNEFREPGEAQEALTPQPRQNVLFEAGMAMMQSSQRTVLVELGPQRGYSDIHGVNTVRLDNSIAKRSKVRTRLLSAGCDIADDGKMDWHKDGDFDAAIAPPASLPGAKKTKSAPKKLLPAKKKPKNAKKSPVPAKKTKAKGSRQN